MTIAVLNIIAFIFTTIGALNWGLVGIFNFNLVSTLFDGSTGIFTTIVYILVLISAIWLVVSLFLDRGKIVFLPEE